MFAKFRSLPAVLLCISASLPILEAGPRFAGGEITAQGTVQITETSRVSPRADSPSDTIYAFIPSFSYLKETNRMDLRANLSLPIRRYDENDELDSNTINFSLAGEIPFGAGPRLSGDWSVSYFDGVQSNYLSNQNLDSETMQASAYADYAFSQRLSLRARTRFSDRSSSGLTTNFLNDNRTTLYALGVHSHQILSGRMGVYAEYLYQKRETTRGLIDQGVDDVDDGLNFGVTGQILPERLFPKLDADLSFGFTSTEASEGLNNDQRDGRDNRLTFNGSLSYPANSKTEVSLNFSRNLSVTDDDRTVEQSNVSLALLYNPQTKLSFETNIGISSNDFIYDNTSRNDDVLLFRVTGRYTIRPNWFSSLSFESRDTSSNVETSDYNSTLITLSTTLVY